MSLEIDLRSKLVADAAIAAIVGSGAAARIYWDVRPQNSALPAIVLSMVFGSRDQTMEGVMEAQDNRVQFDCIASTKSAAVSLRNAVMAEIETPGTTGSTVFQNGFVNFHRAGNAVDTPTGPIRTEQIDATIWFN